MQRPIRIAITCGDTDGIGLEVVSKALSKLKPHKNVQFYLWRKSSAPTSHLRRIDRNYKRLRVSSWSEALKADIKGGRSIIDIATKLPPAKWVEKSAIACMDGHLEGIATAPLSKSAILKSNISAIGHTEILKQVSKRENLFMVFIGDKFNVLLATAHIPLSEVPKTLDETLLLKSIQAGHEVLQVLPAKIRKLPLALLGLNPHAGENGIIGQEESDYYKRALKRARKERITIDGPLVPDAAFLSSNWKKYSLYISPYHDLGLIPFKLVHGQQSGVHITSGLPFVRTSVDHGTAKDIFGKNRANPNSMLEALNWSIRLCEQRALKSK